MKRLAALEQRRKALVAEGHGLADVPPDTRTDEQKARLTAITAEGGELDQVLAEIATEKKLIEAERVMILREGARIEVDADLAGERPWGNFGVFLQAVRCAHIGGGLDPRLALQAAATGMGESSGPDGGYGIPVEFGPGIEKEMWDTGAILSRVNARPIAGNAITFNVINETSRADGSRRGGVLGYWTDEGVAPTATAIKLAQGEMKLRKVAALGYMTDELAADAPALAAELTEAFTEELLFQVEDAIINGLGAGKPLGVLNAPCLVSVTAETGQAAATIVTENLSKMWARLPARSQANAVWLINVDTQPQLDILSIAAGTAALEPRFVTYGPDGILRIKGRPVVPIEYCATIGTVGDIILADLSRYRVIRKASGVEMASSIHVRFTQGENTFRAIYRVDGQPLPRAAMVPYKGTATLSPFVALATRS